MNRREALTSLLALGVLPLLPVNFMAKNTTKKPLNIIGIGSGGSKVMGYFIRQGLDAKYSYIDDVKKNELPPEVDFIYFRNPRKGKFSETEYELHDIPKQVKAMLTADEKYVLLAGFGAYTGTYLTARLALWLKEQKKDFSIIASLPFKFEGAKRAERAEMVLPVLSSCPNFHFFPNEMIRSKYGNLQLLEALGKADEEFWWIFNQVN